MMDFTEKELCVLCERGGKLLVCNDNSCPISVHKDCMGCIPKFNETGNFCCPYCVYRQLYTETCQLRDKVMLAKKALSSFLGENISHGNYSNTDVQNQSKSPSLAECERETSVCEETDLIDNRSGGFSGVCDGSTCKIMVVYDGDAACKEHEMNANEVEPGECKGVPVGDAACKENGMNANEVEPGECKGVPVGNEAGNSEKQCPGWNAKLPLLKGKRRRWSEDEEDMLKEGVQKFASTANKNLPWKKILEFGRHVFDASRTPSDLKDKWRNMSK